MKKYIYALLLMSMGFGFTSAAIAQQFTLTGKVFDKATGKILPGASVYISEIKKGTVTNKEGIFTINIEQGSHLLEISYVGYATDVENIKLEKNTTQNFYLNSSVLEGGNVIVTSFLRATSTKRTPTPVTIIKKEELFRGVASNLIDALSKVPGVSQISTGPAISKPVIRGLSSNRVVVMHDGIRQEGQQWGDEHGIEIDEYNVSRTEVLKVPASLIYGSDALAGVINIISNVPVSEGVMKGNIFSNYQSNNRMMGNHFDLSGNKNGFIWGVNYSTKNAGDYKNKYDGPVFNSRFLERNGGGYVGIEKNWGYTQLSFSNFSQNLGVVEGARAADGRFIMMEDVGGIAKEVIVDAAEEKRFTPRAPMQKIQHTKYTLDNNVKIGNDRLKATFGLQQNQRMEFGNVLDLSEKELFFDLKTFNYAVQYLQAEKNNWKNTFGVNGMHQHNTNKGLTALIPDYTNFDIGAFYYTQKRTDKTSWTGGLRYDQKHMNYINPAQFTCPPGMACIALYDPLYYPRESSKQFNNITGAIGMAHDINEQLTLKLNIARGYRAPNMAELASYGAHQGTNRFEYGNGLLKSEKSLQLDAALEWSNEHMSITGNVFYNNVTDYIFYQKLSATRGGDSVIMDYTNNLAGDKLYAFAFKQSNAHLYGAEFNIDLHPHPLDWLHVENSVSLIRGQFKQALDGSKNLPGIPSARWLSEIRIELFKKSKAIGNSFINVQLDNVFAQNHPFTGYNTETQTPAYTLLNVGYSTQIQNRNKILFSVSLVGQNITDVAYQHHLNRLKYGPVNDATGRMGVFNMGRNFSFKVNIPFGN
jgi:iron complex outermembrane receptor protein